MICFAVCTYERKYSKDTYIKMATIFNWKPKLFISFTEKENLAQFYEELFKLNLFTI